MKRLLRWLVTRMQGGEQPDGFTAFGKTVWFIDNPSPGLIVHEAIHRKQQQRDGWKYYVRYAWEFARYGYRGVSYEKEAYEAQARIDAARIGR